MNGRQPTSAGSPVAHKMGAETIANGRMTMLHDATHRAVRGLARAFATLAACVLLFAGAAWAQSGEPIKIGYGISQTGGLAPNGKSALLAQKIWEEDINAKGGLLGRPVKLVYYDDQTNPATVPGIYTKLLDVDKVDLIIGGYGTNMLAPAMPVVVQKKKMLIGLFGLAVNSEFHYPNYFAMIPSGPAPKTAFTKGFFDTAMAQNPKPQTVAIVAADAEFSVNASEGARDNAKVAGLNVVYDKRYPPSTTDFAPIVRAGSGWHGEGDQRDRLQAEDDRRRLGWPAGDRHQDAARAVAQRLRQLRLLGAGSEDGFPWGGRLLEEVSGQGRLGGRRPARLLHRALGLCADGGPGAGNCRNQDSQRRQAC